MMRYWLQLPQGGHVATRDNVRLYALLAEELGIGGLWVGDHIVIPPGYTSQYPYGERHPVAPDRPFLEAYTVLSYVAGLTNRVRLAVTVAVAPYRHPLLHAKTVATLDHLSGGRLELALGTGWLREEFEALGASYHDRHRITDEYLDAMQRLWAGDPVCYQGQTVAFPTVQCLPRPWQSPHPPLWIGGSNSRALERIQRFRAGWLGPDLPEAGFLATATALRERWAASGRPLPGISAKLWVEAPGRASPGALSICPGEPHTFALLARLADAGTSDIRLDLSRLPSGERPQMITVLVRSLRKEGWLPDVR